MSLLIGAHWLPGEGAEMRSTNPATGEELWNGRAASKVQIQTAVAAARKAFHSWSLTPLEERIGYIEQYRDILSDRKQALAELIAAEAGKMLWDALGEATAMINKIDISVKAYHDRTGYKEGMAGAMRTKLSHRPHGVMAVFGPYNFPGHLPNGHIVPALIAGNTVVFKPSELTPAVAAFMVECWHATDIPTGVINLVQGARETGEALVASDVDGVLFTGSVPTGQAIAKALIDRPQIITALEMGGNNPLIASEVADLRAAAVTTINSAYISSGQRCTCARRLIVPVGSAGDDFVAELIKAISGIKVGAGDEEAFMGPLISPAAADAVLAAQGALIDKGAKALVQAKKLDRGDAFVSPSLLDVTGISELPDEEVFGPLLQLKRVKDFSAAVEEANNTRFGLASGLLSDNEEEYLYYYPRARAGIVNWNQQLTGAASTAPFGGPGLSGNHRPSAYYAADYCAYPVASVENADDKLTLPAMPKGLEY